MEPDNTTTSGGATSTEPETKKMNFEGPIIIRMWPKTPVLYPVALLALVCFLFGQFMGSAPHIKHLQKHVKAVVQQSALEESGGQDAGSAPDAVTDATQTTAAQKSIAAPLAPDELDKELKGFTSGVIVDRILGTLFLLVLGFSLFTLCIDMEIRWALITFSVSVAAILALILLNQQLEFLPALFEKLLSMTPTASPQFYLGFFVIWAILMLISLGVVRFHYVKIESNEVLVIGGLLEQQLRFPTQRMKFVKDVQDVIEYYLPLINSGRLILKFPDHGESVIIDNVLNIEKVITQLDHISSVLKVEERK